MNITIELRSKEPTVKELLSRLVVKKQREERELFYLTRTNRDTDTVKSRGMLIY